MRSKFFKYIGYVLGAGGFVLGIVFGNIFKVLGDSKYAYIYDDYSFNWKLAILAWVVTIFAVISSYAVYVHFLYQEMLIDNQCEIDKDIEKINTAISDIADKIDSKSAEHREG